MSNLSHLFRVGQRVFFRDDSFDAINRFTPCIVKETHENSIVITDTETNTDLYIEQGFNLDMVYPEYNLAPLG